MDLTYQKYFPNPHFLRIKYYFGHIFLYSFKVKLSKGKCSCISSPQQGFKCQLRYCEVISINIFCRIPNSKVLANQGIKSKLLPGPLTYLSAWVGLCASSPQQGFKCQLRYCGMGPFNISCKIPNSNVLVNYQSNILTRPLTHCSTWSNYVP